MRDLCAALANELASQALLILSQDFREGVDAAAGRRKPNFKGMCWRI